MKKKAIFIILLLLVISTLGSAFADFIQQFYNWNLFSVDDDNELYIACSADGKFSNSAVANRDAQLIIVIGKEYSTIHLYEYNFDNSVTNISSSDRVYSITVKSAQGIYQTTGVMYSGSSPIFINNPSSFDSILRNNLRISLLVEQTQLHHTYSFDAIYVSGFSDAENAMYGYESATGLRCDADGIWRYYENNQFVKFTGVLDFHGGKFFVANGVLCSDANGLAEFGGKWYFLSSGQVQTQYTGLALYDGWWFYITNGVLDTSKKGLIPYDGSMFLVADGQILRNVSGLWYDSFDTYEWYYLADGQVVTYYTGLAPYEDTWFYVINGRLATEFTGIVTTNSGAYLVVGGLVLTGSPEKGAAPLAGVPEPVLVAEEEPVDESEFSETAVGDTSAIEELPSEVSTQRDKIEAFIVRCYNIILNREPNADEVSKWMNMIENGSGAANIIDGIVNSQEFIDKNNNTSDIVNILSKVMLDHDVAPQDKDNLIGILGQSNSISVVVKAFSESPDFVGLCEGYGLIPGSITAENVEYVEDDRNGAVSDTVNTEAEPAVTDMVVETAIEEILSEFITETVSNEFAIENIPVIEEQPVAENNELVAEEQSAAETNEPVVDEQPVVENNEPITEEQPVVETTETVIEAEPTTENNEIAEEISAAENVAADEEAVIENHETATEEEPAAENNETAAAEESAIENDDAFIEEEPASDNNVPAAEELIDEELPAA